MPTMLEVLQQLKDMGYTEDFNVKLKAMIVGTDHEKKLHQLHSDFVIDQVFRIDEDSDEADEQSIVYAVSSRDGKLKGVIINGYGISSDSDTDEILEEIDRPNGPKKSI